MKRSKVESTNIVEIGYDMPTLTLQIKFQNGSLYDYWPIKKSIYDQFMSAESKGKFFFKNIRNNKDINYRRVDI